MFFYNDDIELTDPAPGIHRKVLAHDDTTAAVSGLSAGDYVITTSSKPLEAGMQVNMVEN